MPTLPAYFTPIRDGVDAQLSQIIQSHRLRWEALGTAAVELCDCADTILSGGKRMRAILGAIGYAAITVDDDADWQAALISRTPITLGAALELYQASALVHDDYLDDAPTRRGQPASHITFQQLHREQGWRGSAQTFGAAGAILLGDLLLSTASETMASCANSPVAIAAFDAMTAEVAVGQYLDVRSQMLPLGAQTPAEDLEAALNVVRHKSARYSVMHPLLIGALTAGTAPDSPALQPLRVYGEEVGIAFQLRDDDLGIFGDPQVTGKPAGDDLREGKRTALLALTWERADASQRELLSTVLGNKSASIEQIEQVREIMLSSGARQAHEDLISRHLGLGMNALSSATGRFIPAAINDLRTVAEILVSRSS